MVGLFFYEKGCRISRLGTRTMKDVQKRKLRFVGESIFRLKLPALIPQGRLTFLTNDSDNNDRGYCVFGLSLMATLRALYFLCEYRSRIAYTTIVLRHSNIIKRY